MYRLVGLMLLLLLTGITRPAASQGNDSCPQPTGDDRPVFSYEYEAGEDLADKFDRQILAWLDSTGSSDGLVEAIQAIQPDPDEQPIITAEIIQADITGDGDLNLLVNINLTYGGGYQRVLAVYGCSEQRYIVLTSMADGDFFDIRAEYPPTRIVTVADLNANGRPEIVSREGVVFQKFEEAIRLYEWDGATLVQTFDSGYSLGFFADVRVEAVADDAQSQALIIHDGWAYGQLVATAVIELMRWRPIRISYAWDSETYTRQCQHFTDKPDTLFETLHSAESYRACGDLASALIHYWRIIDESTLKSWAEDPVFSPANIEPESYGMQAERAYLRAFAHYRLAQIFLTRDDRAAARDIAQQAAAAYPSGQQGHQYAVMAEALVNRFDETDDLASACDAAEVAFETARSDKTDPGIDPEQVYYEPEIGWGFYFYSGFNYAADPHNLFAVPEDISDMVTTPLCLEEYSTR